jgi:hypothetical protein
MGLSGLRNDCAFVMGGCWRVLERGGGLLRLLEGARYEDTLIRLLIPINTFCSLTTASRKNKLKPDEYDFL